jgi:hypothetical protein
MIVMEMKYENINKGPWKWIFRYFRVDWDFFRLHVHLLWHVTSVYQFPIAAFFGRLYHKQEFQRTYSNVDLLVITFIYL